VAAAERGLNLGHFFDPEGVLVATVIQEGLMRVRT
jgi:acyl-CoA thioesterase